VGQTVTRRDDGDAPRAASTVLGAGEIEAIAARVVELLERPAPKLLTAGEVARMLAVDVAFVYAHQRELGVLRLPSNGCRPALRFDRDAVMERLRSSGEQPSAALRDRRARDRRAAMPRDVELLPYEPRSAA
jgi:hypothetical protein